MFVRWLNVCTSAVQNGGFDIIEQYCTRAKIDDASVRACICAHLIVVVFLFSLPNFAVHVHGGECIALKFCPFGGCAECDHHAYPLPTSHGHGRASLYFVQLHLNSFRRFYASNGTMGTRGIGDTWMYIQLNSGTQLRNVKYSTNYGSRQSIRFPCHWK